MAVAVSDTLPAQPANGSSVYRPLGGDGWTAPHAEYSVLTQLTGDATAGASIASLVLDTRFMNIVAVMELLLTGAASVRECELEVISDRPTGARHRVRAQGAMVFISTLGADNLFSWNPPLVVDAEELSWTCLNVDTAVSNCRCRIYCFQKRALEEVPLNVLLASLPSVQFVNSTVG